MEWWSGRSEKEQTGPDGYTNFMGCGVIRLEQTFRMKKDRNADPGRSSSSLGWIWLAIGLCVFIVLLALLGVGRGTPPGSKRFVRGDVSNGSSPNQTGVSATVRSGAAWAPAPTAEEIVTSKVSEFARNRRRIVRAIGRRINKSVPPEIERFFAAVETGKWEEIEVQWKSLAQQSGQYENSANRREDLDPFWPAVLDAYGVAEQAHLWPAQRLLDYGNAVLDSLRPGMVYVGGTDYGRWIPELLNETSGGEQHIIVTQNALADSRYLDFVNTLYSDRMSTLTPEDSQAAFQEYVSDAQKRLEHDQQFADQPKQVRPGEDILMVDGKVQVGGQVSVMAINEKLLQGIMAKNPDLSFAIQESIPLKGTYSDALPLGPLMELGAQSGQGSFTVERAAESLQYWQTTAQQVLADPEATGSPEALKSYSHDVVASANLLAAHDFNGEAEQAYRLAQQLCPYNPEPVSGLADVLVGTGREMEARQLLQDFADKYPNQKKDLERISTYWRAIASAETTR